MNKRTINCIGYHLLQLTAYITFLPLYLYIALFQTHFFHLLAAGFFAHYHVSKDKFWEWFEIIKKTNIPGHQSIRNIQIVRNNLLKGKIITTKQILHLTETFTNSNCKKFGIWPQGKSSELCKYFTGSISAKLLQFPFHIFLFSWYFNWGTNIKGIFTQIGFKFHGLKELI